MDARKDNELTPVKNQTAVERRSDCEIVVTRSFDAPARLVFQAWTKPELFKRWWLPKSSGFSLLSYEADIRTGGGYRLEFAIPGHGAMAFFGKYLEVTPHSRIVWTNEESEDGAITTVTLEEKGGKTLLVLQDLYRSKEALERASGSESGLPEQFAQLDELLLSLGGA